MHPTIVTLQNQSDHDFKRFKSMSSMEPVEIEEKRQTKTSLLPVTAADLVPWDTRRSG